MIFTIARIVEESLRTPPMKNKLPTPYKLLILAVVLLYTFHFGRLYARNTSQEPQEVTYEPYYAYAEELPITTYTSVETHTRVIYEPQWELYEITAYCACEKCCGKWAKNRPNGIVYGASGAALEQDRSIAVDTSVIPYGTLVEIEGFGTYVAEDCGEAINGNRIDMYFDNHSDALKFGRRTVMVKVWRDYNENN